MNTTHPTTNHEQGPKQEGPYSQIQHRLTVALRSLQTTEAVVLGGRTPQPEMVGVLRAFEPSVHPGKLATQIEAMTEQALAPIVQEQVTQPSILDESDDEVNPILQQAYVDGLAASTEEIQHDIQETTK